MTFCEIGEIDGWANRLDTNDAADRPRRVDQVKRVKTQLPQHYGIRKG